MKQLLFFIGISFLIGLFCSSNFSCKRSPCSTPDSFDSLIIDQKTKSELPDILKDTFIYKNGKGDSVIVICDKIQVNYDDQIFGRGTTECPYEKHLIIEKVEYNFSSNISFFNDLNYIINKFKLDPVDQIYVFEKDIFIDGMTWVNLANTPKDSIILNSNIIIGNYLGSRKVLFNKQIGILKIKTLDSIEWKLISKTN